MKHLGGFIWALCVIGGAYGVYHLKYQVVERERELARIKRVIAEERNYTHVLEAELAHLARPQRVAELTRQNTGLQPLNPRQIVSIDVVPMKPAPQESMPVDPDNHDPIGGLIEKFNLVSVQP